MKKIIPFLLSAACIASLAAEETYTEQCRECPCMKEKEKQDKLNSSIKFITPELFKEKLEKLANSTTVVVNVTPQEVRDKHIPGTEKISVDKILEKALELKWPKDAEIILYDRRGISSKKAYAILSSMGYKNISVVEGGMDIWITEKPGLLNIEILQGIQRNYTDDELIAFLLQ